MVGFDLHDPKRRYVPSKPNGPMGEIEGSKIHQGNPNQIREGRMKTLDEKKEVGAPRENQLDQLEEEVWDIWEDDSIVPWKVEA